MGSFQIQGEQAQRVSVIGFQRMERLAGPEDFGVCAFSSQQVFLSQILTLAVGLH